MYLLSRLHHKSKCVNLNADLLDGKTTYDSNWTASNGASIMLQEIQ